MDRDRDAGRRRAQWKRAYVYPWILYLGFILYGTSIPLQFDCAHAESRWQLFLSGSTLKQHVSLPDLLSNIALFVPFGFLIPFVPGGRLRILCRLRITVLGGVLFSTCIEALQVFLPSRSPSMLDVLANSTGALVGACCELAFSAAFARIGTDQIGRSLISRPLKSMLRGFLFVQILGALFPFNVSIDISSLKERVKSSNLAPLVGRWLPTEYRGSVLFAEFWWYVPSGLLFIWCCSREGNQKESKASVSFGLLLAFFPVVIQVLKLLESSGVCDLDRGVAGTIGVLVGVGSAFVLHRRWDLPRFLRVLIIVYLLNVVVSEWTPFQVISEQDVIAAKWAQFELLPFGSYFEKTTLWSVKDLLATVLLTVPLGLYLCWKWSANSIGASSLKIFAAGLALGTMLEVGQVYIRGRYPGVTDIFSLTAGVMAGAYAFRHYSRQVLE